MKCTFTRQPRRRQHGAAALIVVMLLFFLISMVAAYTSRNLVFEQRTASNQYRSTLALEAAEAGLEWGIAQLNAGRVDSSCIPSTADTDLTHLSFRERHLTVDVATGALTRRTAATSSTPVRAGCVFNGTTWDCVCSMPGVAATPLPAAGTGSVQPAFIVRVVPSAGSRPQVVEMESNSCTRRDDDLLAPSAGSCLNFTSLRGGTGDGVAAVKALVTLRGAFTTTPGAALTLGGSLAALPLGTTLTLQNTDAASNGVTLHTAGAASGLPTTGLLRVGLPGVSPANSTVAADATLTPAAQGGFSENDRRFALFFGMRPATYERQPGLPTLDCTAGCSAAAINTRLLRNPGRPIWLLGAGTVTIDENVGSSTTPVLLIVDGDLVFSSSATVTGMIYQRDVDNSGSSWSLSGNTAVQGAVVVEGNLTITGTSAGLAVNYNPALLRQLRVSYGTYVRVPGGWRDF